jgi:hypothetical protein
MLPTLLKIGCKGAEMTGLRDLSNIPTGQRKENKHDQRSRNTPGTSARTGYDQWKRERHKEYRANREECHQRNRKAQIAMGAFHELRQERCPRGAPKQKQANCMGMLERNNDRQEKSKQRGNQEIESESCQDESPVAQWREDRSEGKAKARGQHTADEEHQ